MMRRLGVVFSLAILAGCGAAVPGLQGAPSGNLAARQAAVTLDLLTYNTFGLPAPFGKSLADRFSSMPAALEGHDFVGLQETFSGEARRLMESKAYPYKYRQDQGSFFHPMNSGLTVLSRYPFKTVKFRPFGSCQTTDCFSNKGVLFARVDVPAIGPVDIYNTHYQAHTPYTLQRIENNRMLVEFVRQHDEGYPTFLLGDFNFLEDEDEYGNLQERIGPWDLFRLKNPGDPGFSWHPANPWGDGKGEPERLDYVFWLPNRNYGLDILEAEVVHKARPLSDHYGVRARVNLTRKVL